MLIDPFQRNGKRSAGSKIYECLKEVGKDFVWRMRKSDFYTDRVIRLMFLFGTTLLVIVAILSIGYLIFGPQKHF